MKTISEDKFPEFITKIAEKTDYEYDSEFAELFGVKIIGDDFESFRIHADRDVYDLLDSDNIELLVRASEYDYITVGTCGWAAPINNNISDDNDLPPSQHPQRTRVKIFCTSNTKQIGSSVLFRDKKDQEPTNDFGNAKGSLADAFKSFITQSFKFKPEE